MHLGFSNQLQLMSLFFQIYDECLQLVSVSLGGLPTETLLDLNRLFHSLKSISTLSFARFGKKEEEENYESLKLLLVMERGPLIISRYIFAPLSFLLSLIRSLILTFSIRRIRLPMVRESGTLFDRLLGSYLYLHQYKHFSRAIRYRIEYYIHISCSTLHL